MITTKVNRNIEYIYYILTVIGLIPLNVYAMQELPVIYLYYVYVINTAFKHSRFSF